MKSNIKKTLFTIVSALLLTGCGQSTASTDSSASSSSQKKVSPADVKFQEVQYGNAIFQIPTDWKITEKSDGITFNPPESNDIIQLFYTDTKTDLTGLEELAFSSFIDTFTKDIEGFEISDSTIGGSKAKLIKFEQTATSGTLFKVNMYVFLSKSTLYGLLIGVDDTAPISYRPIYSHIIETIKFTNEVKDNDSSTTTTQEQAPAEDVPREYKNAVKKAQSYADHMNMSEAGIYNQLTSEYGEGFPPEAAQYAIEHIIVDYNKNALEKAKSYANTMYMSEAGIYNQLTSEYGEKFTAEQAQYAIDHLDVDYNYNALKKAESYSEMMSMSDAEIYEQLVSEYGEQFTAEQAQYAIDHLD